MVGFLLYKYIKGEAIIESKERKAYTDYVKKKRNSVNVERN